MFICFVLIRFLRIHIHSAKFDGLNTQWNGAHVNDDGNSADLKNLKPQQEYVIKVIQDGNSVKKTHGFFFKWKEKLYFSRIGLVSAKESTYDRANLMWYLLQEIAFVRTAENTRTSRPQLRLLSRSASSVTLAWDDFDSSER